MAKNTSIKKAGAETEYTPYQIQELQKCIKDPVYFIRNYVKIVNPKGGLVNFELYPYQEKLIDHLHNNRFSLITMSRQQGKTITCAIYLFWRSQFSPHGRFLIASKNEKHALEIASRIRTAYENLPDWLRAGVKFYNKHEMEFDNGSRISCEATTDKTGRGGSMTCVTGDTEICVKDVAGNIDFIPIEELLNHGEITSIDTVNTSQTYVTNTSFQVFDGYSFQPFAGTVVTHSKPVIRLQFNDTFLKCTPNHQLMLPDGSFVRADELEIGQKVYGGFEVTDITEFGNQPVYDLVNVGQKHYYQTNKLISHNCIYLDELAFIKKTIQEDMWTSLQPSISTGGSIIISSTPNGDTDLYAQLYRGCPENGFALFQTHWRDHPDRGDEYYEMMVKQLGVLKTQQEVDCFFLSSDALLVDSMALNNIRAQNPDNHSLGFDFWMPEYSIGGEGKTYLIWLDPATGSLSDKSVIEVFEFPGLKQVAEYKSDNVNIPMIYAKLKWAIKKFAENGADVLWSFERNGIGEAIGALYFNDEHFDVETASLISDEGKIGIFTTPKLKINLCLQLKQLIEKKDGIVIKSDYLLKELKNFVAVGGTYKAKIGYHDDAVMATVGVMKLYKYLSEYNEDAFKQVNQYIDDEASLDESNAPVPFMIC